MLVMPTMTLEMMKIIVAMITNIASQIVFRVLWLLSKADHLCLTYEERRENMLGGSERVDRMEGWVERPHFGRNQEAGEPPRKTQELMILCFPKIKA